MWIIRNRRCPATYSAVAGHRSRHGFVTHCRGVSSLSRLETIETMARIQIGNINIGNRRPSRPRRIPWRLWPEPDNLEDLSNMVSSSTFTSASSTGLSRRSRDSSISMPRLVTPSDDSMPPLAPPTPWRRDSEPVVRFSDFEVLIMRWVHHMNEQKRPRSCPAVVRSAVAELMD